eukprot:Seg234.5 transcript_id=Seg234.5/GoldUCD/mRNA.D3Y31 product="UPF0488 protein C8orf33-like" protein_id=Seg234.5/GoldUCD/D3Y31
MSENLSKEQRKKLKKKEAQKRKKQEKQKRNQDVATSQVDEHLDTKETCLETSLEDEEVDDFEGELCWCIEQLELGIKNRKPTKDEAEKATKLIKILKSEKSAKVKKRQIMRNTFGDYRKKMAEESKQKSSEVKPEPKISSASNEKTKESLFVRTKATSNQNKSAKVEQEEESGTWHFKPSDNSFQFSFSEQK